MKAVNIHEAKTHRSRVVEKAAQGESFIIAKACKSLVKVTALGAPEAGTAKRLGFMLEQFTVPADFYQMRRETIELLCDGTL